MFQIAHEVGPREKGIIVRGPLLSGAAVHLRDMPPVELQVQMADGEELDQVSNEYLIIGKIIAPWGIRGELKVEIWTDFPDRFATLETVHVGGDEGEENYPPRLYDVERTRPHKKHILLKLAGVDTRNDAEQFRQQFLYIPYAEAKPLSPGEYYLHQIIGLQAWTVEGEELGIVSDIWFTGSNDVYVVETAGKPLLLPATVEVIREVDLERGRLVVKLLDGLR